MVGFMASSEVIWGTLSVLHLILFSGYIMPSLTVSGSGSGKIILIR